MNLLFKTFRHKIAERDSFYRSLEMMDKFVRFKCLAKSMKILLILKKEKNITINELRNYFCNTM